ncbi:hypothetical protein [Colwellia hornerae]|uniref:SGNH/GDSL hydrolase family protein n=1 Tax=Colwellia hornerae TaxID=89402 RepID=A0A5C6Q282_9GAMM|nr:hypothetical protein [Colwellia hornerae]TWX52494.1 hypothetical protein ESZ28_12610 [Colwellia hornerae]TWX58323.1 hypothetical protein ESZ26_12575 [Colwellia hornerae]TWX62737.1 hypothetical protein ESZ27_18515 [Colwellia hornerae]
MGGSHGIARGFFRLHDMIGNTIIPHQYQYDDLKVFSKKYRQNIASFFYTQTSDRLFVKKIILSKEKNLSIAHFDQVVDYWQYLHDEMSLNVVMIGMLPPIKTSPINFDYKQPLQPQLQEYISKNSIKMVEYTDTFFSEKLKETGIKYVSKILGFDLSLPKDLINRGKITYSDNRHLSATGEAFFGKKLNNKVLTFN